MPYQAVSGALPFHGGSRRMLAGKPKSYEFRVDISTGLWLDNPMSSKNFFHELQRAPEIHISAKAIANRVPELDEIDLTPYEEFLVSIGQGQNVRYNHRTRS